MGLRWIFSVFVVGLVLLAPMRGAAQSGSEEDARAGDARDDARTGDARDDEARTLFKAATIAYADGRFDDAVEHFRRAYELSERPELLFNIGAAAERLGRDRAAVEAYRAYLDKVPDAENRRFAESRIEILRERLGRQEAEVPSPRQAAKASAPGPGEGGAEPVDDGESGGIVGEWWLWTGVGVVVIGAVVTGVLLAGGSGGSDGIALTGDDGRVYEALRVGR